MGEHDQLFKWTFRVPEHAAGELRSVLPRELVEAIDFGSLELVQSDVVSQKLDERFSDALFHATFRGVPGYVWLLLEHQSEPDRFMVLRVLDYLVRSWVELLRREPERKTLPPVVCVVVHHGEEGWTAPVSLHGLVEGLETVPALKELVPNFRIIVDDLVRQPDEELKRRPLGTLPQVALWVLRDARKIERLREHLQAWSAELGRVMAAAPEDGRTVLRYILMVTGDEQFDDFKQRIIDVVPEAESTMASIGEELIQRGRMQGRAEGEAKGKAEGEAKGKAEGVLAVLEARGLKLGAEERSRILSSKNIAELDRWLRLAATAGAVNELFSS